ncbi:uncharacterized protein BYT42DRAFT_478386, partial [Radiomyces spectabilis]|uniref:uncharacterized protein n=1 Tax=Radiomyces spectabilis TaxID=64574 RepID=UPI00221E8A53
DLQDVILYYQSQPELLRLILLSKVEEDKRRTEEAKLRAKELDLMILQQQQQQQQQHFQSSSSNTVDMDTMAAPSSLTHSTSMSPPMAGPVQNIRMMSFPERRNSIDMLLENAQRRDSALDSSFDDSTHSEELDDRSFSPISTPAAAASLLHMASPSIEDTQFHVDLENHHRLSGTSADESLRSQNDPYSAQRPRRRREMQAITKIVETREFPYADGYFWKNNGNTIQKKTGNKSVYYKCSNSTKGCPVNKTVTWKENGEFLIKYRGEHIAECGKVQRIVD